MQYSGHMWLGIEKHVQSNNTLPSKVKKPGPCYLRIISEYMTQLTRLQLEPFESGN